MTEGDYLIAGQEAIDNEPALKKLDTVFGMKRVMIGGAPLSEAEARSFTLIEARSLENQAVLLRYMVDKR